MMYFKKQQPVLLRITLILGLSLSFLPDRALAASSDIQFEAEQNVDPKLVCYQGEPVIFDGNVKRLTGYREKLTQEFQATKASLQARIKQFKKLKRLKKPKKQMAKLSKVIESLKKNVAALKKEKAELESVCSSQAPISASLSSGSLALLASNPSSPVPIAALPSSPSGGSLLTLIGSNFDRDMYLKVEVLSEAGNVRRTLILPFRFVDPSEIEVKLLTVAPAMTRFELFLVDESNNLLASGPLPVEFVDSTDECIDGQDNDGDGLVDTNDFGCTGPSDQSEGGLVTGTIENRWTVVEPSADSRIIYVSSSGGNDANSGLSQATPKRTVNAARLLARAGYPDWILLKRGDDFTSSQHELFPITSGRGLTEPTVIAPYGDPAASLPRVRGGLMSSAGYQSVSHLYIMGLDFGSQQISSHVGGANLLLEGNRFKDPQTAIDLQGLLAPAINYRVRNNIVDGTVNNSFFFKKINGLNVYGNVIVRPSYGTLGNHAMYITREGNQNVVIEENLVRNEKTHGNGIMARPGALAIMNLVMGYGYSGLTFGACNDGTQPSCYPNNVVFHSEKNMFLGHYSNAWIGCGTTVETQYIASGLIEKNLRVAASSPNCYAGPWGVPTGYSGTNIMVAGNKTLSTSTPLESYQTVLGETPSVQAFWSNALAGTKFRELDERYTAEELYAFLWAQ